MDHRRFYSSNNRIHISDISQENWHGKAYVQGIVTLKWPYSISENTSRILLSEENLDKRRDKGQLIVVMHGHLAEEFVQKVKNNDRIAISREGAELQESQPSDKDTKSAANSSGWTLSISRSITAVVESCSQGANVSYAAPVLFEYSNPWMSGLTLPNRKYTPIADIDEKSGTVNIAGVIITYKDISQPKDYCSSFVIADPSTNQGLTKIEDINAVDGLRVLIFDRERIEVPQISAIGEIVLIRNLTVKEYNYRPQAMSPAFPPEAQCIWTLFTSDESKVIIPPKSERKIEQLHQLRQAEAQGTLSDAQEFQYSVLQAKSPELEDAEIEYVKYLRNWWEFATTSNDETSSDADPQPTRFVPTRGRPTIKLSQLQERQFCDFVGHIVSIKSGAGRNNLVLDLVVTDYTSNKRLRLNALRDGKSVRDIDGSVDEVSDELDEYGPQFPFGRRCFDLTLWDQNAYSGEVILKLGDVVLFQNVAPLPHRVNDDGLLYGKIHGDVKNPKKVFFEVLTVGDERREAIMQARRDHFQMVEKVRSSLLRDQFSQPANVDEDLLEGPPKKGQRSRARSEADESFAQAVERATSTPKWLSESVISPDDSPVPKKKIKTHSSKQTFGRSPISCYYAHLPKASLAEILKQPEVPTKFRTEARVVDFQPRNLQDFCVPFCTKCELTYDHVKYRRCPGCNDGDPGYIHWVWKFAFILEGKEPATVRAIVCDEDAKVFLEGIEACDLYESDESLEMLRDRLSNIWGNVEDVLDADEPPAGPTREWGGFYDWCLKTYQSGENTHYRVFGTSLRL